MSDFEWSWWRNGEPNTHGEDFVEVIVGEGDTEVQLVAGTQDYDLWGSVYLTPVTAVLLSDALLRAAHVASES